MNKSNSILSAAVLGALLVMTGAANAATAVSTASIKYAAEQFAGTTPSAAVVAPTMNIVSSTALPSGSVVTVMVELTGGIFGAAPTGGVNNVAAAGAVTTSALGAVTPTVTIGSTITGTTTAAAGVGATVTATTNNANVVVLTMTTTNAIGIGGTIATITTPTISAAGLASTAATVTANATILVGSIAAPVGAAVPTSGTLEAASGATTIATSAKGITLTAAANTSAAKIDLTATVPSTKFTVGAASATETASATLYKLGTLTVTDGTAKVVDGTTAYVTGAKTTIATVTAPAGFFAALGTTGVITVRATNATACAGAVVGAATSATFATAALASAATSISTPAANFTGAVAPGTAVDVCMSVNGTTAIAAGTPSLTATLGAAAAQDSADTLAATNLETLALNGAQTDVRSYIPAAATGYASYIRVINTGSVAAPVSGQFVGIDGAVTTAGTIISSLPAGGAQTLTAAQIEAVLGAPAGGATVRPRLRVTGPTNGLQVQSFMSSPAGVFTDMTGAQ